jgi:hypothetical protein
MPGKQISFIAGTIVSSTWLNDQQEVDSPSAWGIKITKLSSTTIRIPAVNDGTNVQSTLRIDGQPLYMTAAVDDDFTARGAGSYSVYLVNAGSHTYTVTSTTGAAPASSRKIGEVDWNGTAITAIRNMIAAVAGHSYHHRFGGDDALPAGSVDVTQLAQNVLDLLFPVGSELPWTGKGDPISTNFLAAEGRTITEASFPAFALTCGSTAPVGETHKYNGGISPGAGLVRLPDKRGKSPVGASNMGTAQGNASGNGRVQLAAGASTGEVLHNNQPGEAGMPAHNPAVAVTIGPQSGNILGDDGNGSATTFEFTYPNGTPGGHLIKRQAQYAVTSATASVGAVVGTGHNTVHPVEADNWIVRVK